MNEDRIDQVSQAISLLGYEGIVKFDEEEPEYKTFTRLKTEVGEESYRALLGICAGTADYQLAGNAQQFWTELEEVTVEHGSLDSQQDIKEVLGTFMEADVNARLNQQKRTRLIKLFENGFTDWFLSTYGTGEPLVVWAELAEALENPMRRKTVVFAMKVYDIIHLIENGTYLEFPKDIPIPCDLQVERVAATSGIADSESEEEVMAAWTEVADRVSAELDQDISLLRIDSIVWQAGQIIGDYEPDQEASRKALIDHFEEVGLHETEASDLAIELIGEM